MSVLHTERFDFPVMQRSSLSSIVPDHQYVFDIGFEEFLANRAKSRFPIKRFQMGLGIHAVARIAALSRHRHQEIGKLTADTSVAMGSADRDALDLRVLRQVTKPARRYRFTADFSKNVHGVCLVLIPFDVVGDTLFSAKHDTPDHKCFELVLGRGCDSKRCAHVEESTRNRFKHHPGSLGAETGIETPAWVESNPIDPP